MFYAWWHQLGRFLGSKRSHKNRTSVAKPRRLGLRLESLENRLAPAALLTTKVLVHLEAKLDNAAAKIAKLNEPPQQTHAPALLAVVAAKEGKVLATLNQIFETRLTPAISPAVADKLYSLVDLALDRIATATGVPLPGTTGTTPTTPAPAPTPGAPSTTTTTPAPGTGTPTTQAPVTGTEGTTPPTPTTGSSSPSSDSSPPPPYSAEVPVAAEAPVEAPVEGPAAPPAEEAPPAE